MSLFRRFGIECVQPLSSKLVWNLHEPIMGRQVLTTQMSTPLYLPKSALSCEGTPTCDPCQVKDGPVQDWNKTHPTAPVVPGAISPGVRISKALCKRSSGLDMMECSVSEPETRRTTRRPGTGFNSMRCIRKLSQCSRTYFIGIPFLAWRSHERAVSDCKACTQDRILEVNGCTSGATCFQQPAFAQNRKNGWRRVGEQKAQASTAMESLAESRADAAFNSFWHCQEFMRRCRSF